MALNGNRTRTRTPRISHERGQDASQLQRQSQSPPPPPPPNVLDQAIAINGDLRVQLFGLNVVPIKVRLLVSSKDVAAELGLDWWRRPREAEEVRRAGSRRRRPRDGA